ncbi:MAG: sulfur carrier protein ThiS [Bacteroidales bacterium]|nr:sulfur carrier protein ThiS [Bacteroidales bacterium]
MTIIVNNQPMSVPDGCSVKALCEIMNLKNSDGAAVAVGMEVLEKQDYESRLLCEGDKVTIIRATCGG